MAVTRTIEGKCSQCGYSGQVVHKHCSSIHLNVNGIPVLEVTKDEREERSAILRVQLDADGQPKMAEFGKPALRTILRCPKHDI